MCCPRALTQDLRDVDETREVSEVVKGKAIGLEMPEVTVEAKPSSDACP